jgi:hypothetical protein
MGSSLDRVLAAADVQLTTPAQEPYYGPDAEFALAAQVLGDAFLVLAKKDPDDDGDDDSSDEGDTDADADHTGHALFKKLRGRMGDKNAAKMCAKADAKKVAASMVGRALTMLGLVELSVTQAERDKANEAGNSLPDKSYPINTVKQLHSAAILAASKHGDYKAAQTLIRRRAKELGVDVNTLPGFGSSDDDEKMAASMIALAGGGMPMEPPLGMDHSGVMGHGAFTGSHRHAHAVMAAHDHPHFHNGDSHHEHHPGLPRHP